MASCTQERTGRVADCFLAARILLFYVPLAAVAIYLNRNMPLEGGLYRWAKLGFDDFIGFLAGWNLWLYIILIHVVANSAELTRSIGQAAPGCITSNAKEISRGSQQ